MDYLFPAFFKTQLMLTRLQIEMMHVHVAPKFSPWITMMADKIARSDTLRYLVVNGQLKLFINGKTIWAL